MSGYVEDAETGEQLIGATVYITELETGTASNVYGYFSITLDEGTYNIVTSYVGYESHSEKIVLKSNQVFNFKLKPSVVLSEVVVSGEATDKIEEKTQMSSIKVSMEKVNKLPAFMGEKDLVKTIQLLPGVQSGSEGSSGLYVRGGGPDQNLMLLDGVPVYNASHLFGFFSVFNSEAINSVELIKGGFPARYGGRLSSVLDIRMKEGNTKEFKGDISVGIIASKISLEGPIIKDKTSFIVSARRTYVDVLARPFISLSNANTKYTDPDGTEAQDRITGGYYFYDLNFKINHKFSNRSRLFLSSYLGKDKFYSKIEYTEDNPNGDYYEDKSKLDLNWGNKIAALRWNYIINPKLFANATLTYSQYAFNTDITNTISDYYKYNDSISTENFAVLFNSGIDDITAKVDFDYTPSPNHYVRFGLGNIYHVFSPGATQVKVESEGDDFNLNDNPDKTKAQEMYAYVEDDWLVNKKLKINAGLHFSGFVLSKKNYWSLQPRISSRYLLSKTSSLKASYAHMAQFLHLLSNPTIGLPTDLWVPATDKVLPQYSHQVALGYAKSIRKKYELSIEGYYKSMNNIIEYKDGTSFMLSDQTWEEKVEAGKGWSYGVELLLEKKIGKLSGWLGYTLSWSNRQFTNISFGEKFPYRYDRRHDISFVTTYELSDKWDFGLIWVYGTGNAYTLGLERYAGYSLYNNNNQFQNQYQNIEHIENRNNYRAPAYHRLDIGANYHRKGKWGETIWNFSLYNAYSRQNPFYLDFKTKSNGERVLTQIALFPIIPSVSYNFKF